MFRFWIVVLGITGVAIAIVIAGSPITRRWPRWLAMFWAGSVVTTAALLVATAIYQW